MRDIIDTCSRVHGLWINDDLLHHWVPVPPHWRVHSQLCVKPGLHSLLYNLRRRCRGLLFLSYSVIIKPDWCTWCGPNRGTENPEKSSTGGGGNTSKNNMMTPLMCPFNPLMIRDCMQIPIIVFGGLREIAWRGQCHFSYDGGNLLLCTKS